MSKTTLSEMTTDDLVARFAEIGRAQDRALLGAPREYWVSCFDCVSSQL
jgi:hypothetical protein